jgi:NAD(P)-dependent dehydrogenase (short-subunit alcohol dehydrogenase family)
MFRGFAGSVVVLTGATSGLGRALARLLARHGAKVALIARGRDALEATATEVRALGGEPLALSLDVSDAGAVDQAGHRVVAQWGMPDVWINNAMVSVFAPVEEIAPEEYRRVAEVNYLGTVHGTLAALRYMRPRDRGVIVQVGSALAYRSIPLQAAYCASKAAVRAFTDSVRCELARARSGVRLTMVQLPAMNTPHFQVVRNRLGRHTRPVPPIYQPEPIAEAVLHAAWRAPRERWVGWRTAQAIVGQHVMPGMLDRYLGEYAWDSQSTSALPLPAGDNLDAPLPGDHGAQGPFGSEARGSPRFAWTGVHPALVAGGGLAALALGALAFGGLRRRRG